MIIAEGAIDEFKGQLVLAFTEWERRYREEPELFFTDQQRLAETEQTLGDMRAAYLIELLTGRQGGPVASSGVQQLDPISLGGPPERRLGREAGADG